MKSRIDVAICLDARMLDAACVLLASIKAHARTDRPVRVFAVTDFEALELRDLAGVMNEAQFKLVPVTCSNVHGNFPIRGHVSAGTYLRFVLPTLLPDIDRLLYLDIDTIVHSDLAPLFDTPLDGFTTAAMPDWPMLVGSRTWPTYFIPHEGKRLRFAAYAKAVLGLDCDGTTNYFNCGVLLMDLALWRHEDIAGRTIRYLVDHPALHYLDQDALNAVVAGRYVRLDADWNSLAVCSYPSRLFILGVTRAGRRWEAIRTIWRGKPRIVHYAGANKPWLPHQPTTPRDALWWHYAALSPLKAKIVAVYRGQETAKEKRRSKIPAGVS